MTTSKQDNERKNSRGYSILIICGLYAILVVAAVTVPRYAAQGMDGLGAAGAAGGAFILFGALAALVSLIALVMVAWSWRRLSVTLRVVGLTPFVLSAVAVAGLALFLKYEMQYAPQSFEMEPKTQEKLE